MANKINDDVRGTRWDDSISTGNGNDVVRGLRGDDQLDGGNGKDILHGAKGNDILTGGNGKDVFLFRSLQYEGEDIITDFHNDQIDLQRYNTDFDTLAARFTDVDGDAVIYTGHGTITLIGVSSADLSASDFIL